MRQKALMVGVNNFKDPSINGLNGCVNDMLDLRALAKKWFGFTNLDIHCLTDSRATKKNIMDRLCSLRDWAKPGDSVIFSFSGHGSQIRDRHRDELSDHLDELICPYDMDWDKGTYILDDEMHSILDSFTTGVHFEAIIDACHSATMFRNGVGFPKAVGAKIQSRYTPPPLSIALRAEGDENIMAPTMRFCHRDVTAAQKVLWAGCKTTQTSADAYFSGRYNGAMTYAFCQIVGRAKGKITRRDTITGMQKMLKRAGYEQIPQLEGTKATYDSNIFSV